MIWKIFKIIMCLFIVFFIALIIMQNRAKKLKNDINETLKEYKNIQFKGSVVKIYPIERGGRVYRVMCVIRLF